jgi:hypothetical protein
MDGTRMVRTLPLQSGRPTFMNTAVREKCSGSSSAMIGPSARRSGAPLHSKRVQKPYRTLMSNEEYKALKRPRALRSNQRIARLKAKTAFLEPDIRRARRGAIERAKPAPLTSYACSHPWVAARNLRFLNTRCGCSVAGSRSRPGGCPAYPPTPCDNPASIPIDRSTPAPSARGCPFAV